MIIEEFVWVLQPQVSVLVIHVAAQLSLTGQGLVTVQVLWVVQFLSAFIPIVKHHKWWRNMEQEWTTLGYKVNRQSNS